MSKPVVVSVPHRLGREEAVRRLKAGFERAGSQFAGILNISDQTWSGDRLTWPRSLLRTALKFTLPWELAHTAWWNVLLRSGNHGAMLDRLLLSLVVAAIAVYLISLFVGSRRAPYDRVTGTFVIAKKTP